MNRLVVGLYLLLESEELLHLHFLVEKLGIYVRVHAQGRVVDVLHLFVYQNSQLAEPVVNVIEGVAPVLPFYPENYFLESF